MTTHDPADLVLRMQECFNTRQFDQADDLFTPDFFSHALGATGFEAGKDAWRRLVAHFPDYRVIAEDVLVDHDKVAVRSNVEGVPTPAGDPQPMRSKSSASRMTGSPRCGDSARDSPWRSSAPTTPQTDPANRHHRVNETVVDQQGWAAGRTTGVDA